MNNPYLELYSIMKEAPDIEAPFFMGEIKSVSPFTIQLNDIVLDKDDLLIDSAMYKLHKTSNAEVQDKLKASDKVVLLRINEKFIIISKVVAV